MTTAEHSFGTTAKQREEFARQTAERHAHDQAKAKADQLAARIAYFRRGRPAQPDHRDRLPPELVKELRRDIEEKSRSVGYTINYEAERILEKEVASIRQGKERAEEELSSIKSRARDASDKADRARNSLMEIRGKFEAARRELPDIAAAEKRVSELLKEAARLREMITISLSGAIEIRTREVVLARLDAEHREHEQHTAEAERKVRTAEASIADAEARRQAAIQDRVSKEEICEECILRLHGHLPLFDDPAFGA